ncbi:hypothetical protein ACPPVW_13785 [Leifsonia sp. McL0607]|uniref:hypothetical protein n=1 Tax=Leifsonia sp. McL0607 TaxID=3415672 RepID=UPI003CF841AB
MTAIAWVLGAGCFLNLMHPSGYIPFFVALLGLIIVTQILYSRRLGFVRQVASQLSREFPGDHFLVGNVRFVGPGDSGPDSVDFTTTVLQFSDTALSLWNPDSPSHPLVAIPFENVDVEVTKKTPPRWVVIAPYSAGETHIALFTETGLGFEREGRMNVLAHELFNLGGVTEPRAAPKGGSETL